MKLQPRVRAETSLGYRGLKGFVEDLRGGRPLHDFGTHLARMIVDLDGMATGVYARAVQERELACVNVVEQAPNPDSRVMLSDELDALGLRRIKLDWRISELEKRSLRQAQRVVGAELAAAGLGRMNLGQDGESDEWAGPPSGATPAPGTSFDVGHHHTGTTRMADDPSAGVVDRHCRVFGVGNLFVAGSSVFPTLGSANPTLTIVAFALRLADHIRELPGQSN
jgi:choline dehydrogenase-like flavoprotein